MLSRFLDFVEIRTKITSIFAFLLAVVYLVYINQPINYKLTLLFFASMLIFDLTTTAINNYIDSKNDKQTLQFSRRTALIIICVLFIIGVVFGLYLAYLTDIVVLTIGGICFLCGIFYTYGPVPISRMPLGEILSGIFYGVFIPFLLLYINMPIGTYMAYGVSWETIFVVVHFRPLIALGLLAMIPFCTTANIMLANNICDLEKDITVKRHTLPYYIGDNALVLFAVLYYMTYVAVGAMVLLKILSPICLLSFLNIFLVQKNINVFMKKQEKSSTFSMAIKNYLIIMGSIVVLILISGIIF